MSYGGLPDYPCELDPDAIPERFQVTEPLYLELAEPEEISSWVCRAKVAGRPWLRQEGGVCVVRPREVTITFRRSSVVGGAWWLATVEVTGPGLTEGNPTPFDNATATWFPKLPVPIAEPIPGMPDWLGALVESATPPF